MVAAQITDAERAFLFEVGKYDGADCTAHGSPKHLMALSLEQRGLLKATTIGEREDYWKLCGPALRMVFAAT